MNTLVVRECNWWGREGWRVSHYFQKRQSLCRQKLKLMSDCTRFPRMGGEWQKCAECQRKVRA
jgi:hypothetical protein